VSLPQKKKKGKGSVVFSPFILFVSLHRTLFDRGRKKKRGEAGDVIQSSIPSMGGRKKEKEAGSRVFLPTPATKREKKKGEGKRKEKTVFPTFLSSNCRRG